MDRVEDSELFWLFSSSGTPHIGIKKYSSFESFCSKVKKDDTGLEEPIEFEGLDDHEDICGICKNYFEEKYQDVTVAIHIPKKDGIDIKEHLSDTSTLSEERREEIIETLERRIR